MVIFLVYGVTQQKIVNERLSIKILNQSYSLVFYGMCCINIKTPKNMVVLLLNFFNKFSVTGYAPFLS